jgi:hypothetical protein
VSTRVRWSLTDDSVPTAPGNKHRPAKGLRQRLVQERFPVLLCNFREQLLAHSYEPEVGATIQTAEQTHELRAEKCLVSTSRQPNSDKIAIEKAGIVVGKLLWPAYGMCRIRRCDLLIDQKIVQHPHRSECRLQVNRDR